MNTAGIVINQSYENLGQLETVLGTSLKSNILTKRKGKIIFLKDATLILADSELATDPFNIENTETLSFVISNTTNSYALNFCRNNSLVRGLICLNDEIIEDFGDKLEEEQETDDIQSIVTMIIENVLKTHLFDAIQNRNYKKIDINKLQSQYYKVIKSSPPEKPKQIERNKVLPIQLSDSFDDQLIDDYFEKLTDENEGKVLATLHAVSCEDLNKQVLSYMLNLAHFHWSLKVRRSALKIVEKYASNSLWEVFNSAWDKKYFPKQMYRNRTLLNHEDVDASEYLVFAQANRRNYFNVKPKKGDVVYMSSRYNDEAENIFECYNVNVNTISKRILRLQNIGSANFRNSANLDWTDTLDKLAQLSNLHFLQIAQCKLANIPSNLGKIQNLKKLILEEENLTHLPDDLKLSELSCIDIKRTKINLIDFKNFPKLIELWIDGKHKLEKMTLKNLNREILVTSGRSYSEKIQYGC